MYINNENYEQSAVSGDVLCYTRAGLVEIASLAGEKDVSLMSGDGGEVEAEEIAPMGEHSAYAVTLEDGLVIRGTYNHAIRCAGRVGGPDTMTTIEHITPGDVVIVPVEPRHTVRGKDEGVELSDYIIGGRCDELPQELLRLPKDDVAKLVMLLLVGDEQKTGIGFDSGNGITLFHDCSSSRASFQLQQLLLAYYGVMSRRQGAHIAVRDAELAKLNRKCEISRYLCEAGKAGNDIGYDQLEGLLSLCEYSDERWYAQRKVVNVESIGRVPTYGVRFSDRRKTFVANGFINDGLR